MKKPKRVRRKARFKIGRGEVVWMKEEEEYANFIEWDTRDPSVAKIFNPRCGEKYYAKIRPLTAKEIGPRRGRG